MNIAVIGYGSIGQRHAQNGQKLGYTVDVYSNHKNKKLRNIQYDLVIVATKTSDHLKNIKQFKNISNNFFIEKPLAANYKDGLAIKKLLTGKKVRIGYCLIFNPIIKKVKEVLDKKSLGNISFAQIYAGSYLPDWREGVDYRKRYSAKKEEGGGVELDLIHEINYTQYFFKDKIMEASSYFDKVSKLEISSHDFAHIVLKQKSRLITITLNYFQLLPERYVKLIGQEGVLFADLIKNEIAIFDKRLKKVYGKKFDIDINQMYIDEIKSMIKFIAGKEKQQPILGIDQAIRDLHIVASDTNERLF